MVGVLAVAYAFDLCSGLNPCTVSTVRSGHTWQRALKIVRLPVFLCWVRERGPRLLSCTAHVVCQRRKVMRWHSVMCAMSGITATAWIFPVRSTGSVRDVYMSNEQSESEPCLLFSALLKLYLPALYRVATSNHTRVCLHSRELLSFPTLRVVCTCLLFVCTQVSCCWSRSTFRVVCI